MSVLKPARPLPSIFSPSSIAVAGAAPGNIGQAFLQCLVDSGFKGALYPLNPRSEGMNGLKAYASLADIPGRVDYVISCIRAGLSVQLMRDCAAKGVKAVSFFTAGFSESPNEDGFRLEQEVVSLGRAGGVRVLGPNCLGIYQPDAGLSFASDFPREAGRVGLVCQSGGNAVYLIRSAAQRGLRFSKAISYGNAADIDESEILDYFREDPDTEVVAAYIEGVKNGDRFTRACRMLAGVKPLVVVKSGTSNAGTRAAASHTGALSGRDRIWDSFLDQINAIRVPDLESMVDVLVALCFLPPSGRRVAVFGSGGGFSVISADCFAGNGLLLTSFSLDLQEQLSRQVRTFINTDAGFLLDNPVDMTNLPTADGHYAIMRTLAQQRDIDLLVGQFSVNNSAWPFAGSDLSGWTGFFTDSLLKVRAETGKPAAVVIHAVLSSWDMQRALELQAKCCAQGLAVFRAPAAAAQAIRRVMDYREKVRRP